MMFSAYDDVSLRRWRCHDTRHAAALYAPFDMPHDDADAAATLL